MALIPQLSTGVPTRKADTLLIGSVNRANTTAKNLFMLRKGEFVAQMSYFGNAASNAGTTATLSVGLKLLDNSGAAAGPVLAVYMTSQGSGYTSTPTVGFAGGGGSGAAATAIINSAGQVIGVKMTNYGTGYTSAPTVSFTGGAGSNAAGTAMVVLATSFINAVDIKTAGTGAGQQTPVGVTGLYVPMPFDIMVTGTYAETGTAGTAGGPWYVQAGTVLPGPLEYGSFVS